MAGMMTLVEHECDESATESVSTLEAPYQFVGSGLDNVFLVGVNYTVCRICGQQSAEIPALKGLLGAIARTLMAKSGLLTGQQVRFLRKRLRRSSSDFAWLLGLDVAGLASIELSDAEVPAGLDQSVRKIYEFMSKKKPSSIEKVKELLTSWDGSGSDDWVTDIHGSGASERMIATWQKSHRWKVETQLIAA